MCFLKLQFANLHFYFWLSLIICIFGSIAATFYFEIQILHLAIGISGTLYAFFAGQGKIICFFFGLIYCLGYIYICYETKLYGDLMLTILYIPLNILGIFTWRKNQNLSKTKILIRKLTKHNFIMYILAGLFVSLIYGFFLQKIHSEFPFLNAFSTMAQILAFYLQIQRYQENYLIVTFANGILCYIWLNLFLQQTTYLPQLFNATIFLLLGIFYYFKWKKEAQ